MGVTSRDYFFKGFGSTGAPLTVHAARHHASSYCKSSGFIVALMSSRNWYQSIESSFSSALTLSSLFVPYPQFIELRQLPI